MDLQEAEQAIENWDLSSTQERLISIEGWHPDDVKEVMVQYRRYLRLRRKYFDNGKELPPSKCIDEAWHAHVLHTVEYHQFCSEVFGEYLHHHPHRAHEASTEALEKAFAETQRLYIAEYGEPMFKVLGRSHIGRFVDSIREKVVKRFPSLQDTIAVS